MSRAALLLASLAAALAVALALQVMAGPDSVADAPYAEAVAPRPAAAPQGASGEDDTEDRLDHLVEAVLERPLFNQGRRPLGSAEGPAGPVADEAMPRLAGVIITPGSRRAIFAPAEGKPLVVQEGGSVGRYVVRSIAPGRVTLSDADGQHIIRPSFAKGTKP